MNKIDRTIYDNLDLLPEDLTGWNGASDIFNVLIDRIKPTTIIEVGTWKGLSTITMGKCIQALNLPTKIYCVDTWLGSIEFWDEYAHTEDRNLMLKNGYPNIYYQFLSNVVHNKLEDVIIPFPNTSDNGFRFFQRKNINADIIYIDASHEEEDVYKDIFNYFQLLNNNGVIFGDDFSDWAGVQNAVNRFATENNLNVFVVANNYWVIYKTENSL